MRRGVAQPPERQGAAVQDLGVPHRDHLAGRALHADAQPSGEVLVEVENGLPVRPGQDADRTQDLGAADGRARRRDQQGRVVGVAEQVARRRCRRRLPVGRVEQSGLHVRPVAPVTGRAVMTVHPDADAAPRTGGKRREGPGDEHRLPRLDEAGGGAVVEFELVRRPGDPGQARGALADPDGLAVVFEGDGLGVQEGHVIP
ncbi:hypothetical protein SMD20_46085 [Nonomuraea sp. LP-02]|nr:hypothetical protein [Nonomuraea sp. LP-02]MED7931659.1 hypothetical protein [Nonomuraea sp. LP-02]